MKIYAVYANADMTEGRGPMYIVRLYVSEDMAWEYVNTQKGVMGRNPFVSSRYVKLHERHKDQPCQGWKCKVCWPSGGDWEVREWDVIE